MLMLLVTMALSAPNIGSAVMERCSTLCEAGLGGKPCGCPPDQVASVLHNEVTTWRVAHPEERVIRGPRRGLCPALCAQKLGQPLCRCPQVEPDQGLLEVNNDWCPLCHQLLYTENSPDLWIKLACNEEKLNNICTNVTKTHDKIIKRDIRNQIFDLASNNTIDLRSNEVDWNLWCEVQCDNNNGGLACNCDMLPLSLNKK